ncbi:MAG TPA: cytochrome P450 [Acidimicrobiales bacterium]|nr:cytochrome P450 [Acidimicrobiales bacterium]
MPRTEPVTDWTTDFDVLDEGYVEDPYGIWDQLRTTCPVASTTRRGKAWLPTRYADVTAIAHDTATFSSSDVAVVPAVEVEGEEDVLPYGLPPITSDPPLHTWTRRLLLPWFSHRRVDEYEELTRKVCSSLIDGFEGAGRADAAVDYAQQIPVRVIAHILGVPEEMSDTFTGWVRDSLEFADDPERRRRGNYGIGEFLWQKLQERKLEPGDDLMSGLLAARVEDEPVEDSIVLGMAMLTLIAGIDTTWSAIGASLWHLATHDEDRVRLVGDPGLMGTAVEELLRAYAPVTMAREVTVDTEVAGCPMRAGDKVLMSFPAANRDPEVFDRADEVVLDRKANRHVAFGSGIHRCAGSNLARMELRVALEAWLERIPSFHVVEDEPVTWAGGQVRGPRSIPVVFR